MSATREALLLPGVFLTVTLLGGLRVGDAVRLHPPALSSLVLAMLLVGALARARVLVPDFLMHARRSPLENTSGTIVLLSLFAASAQVFNLLTPERGLLRALFTVFFVVQLLTTLAAVAARIAMLRGLLVLMGSAFVLRFIVLESLYTPGGGLLTRMLTAALEGVTLGSFDYDPHAAVTGYVGFFTLALYFVGLVLLAPPAGTAIERADATARLPVVSGVLLLAALLLPVGCGRNDAAAPEQTGAPASPASAPTESHTAQDRLAALKAARVWRPPAVPIGQADLKDNAPGAGAFPAGSEVSCRLVLERVGGTTPKFNCELPGNDVVKIKYGSTNPELHAEVASSRLLNALGFGADRMCNWKIWYFHRPLYRSGRYQDAARALRVALEPLLVDGGVQVVFSGHEHFYERTHPQNGILYFVSGAAGSLRRGDIRPSPYTAKGFDQDYHFMLVEISGDELFVQALSRAGATVDAGVVTRTPNRSSLTIPSP
jgi:Calcineurin-like phosphoesterase